MSSQQKNNFFIIAFIFSLVGVLTIIFGDFGWWYSYYAGATYYVYFSFADYPIESAVMLIVIVFMVFSVLIAFQGLRGATGDQMNKNIGFALLTSFGAFILIAIGAVVFVLNVQDATNWGFDWGFYGGIVGAVVSTIMFYLIKTQK